jgi:hypothetical protein
MAQKSSKTGGASKPCRVLRSKSTWGDSARSPVAGMSLSRDAVSVSPPAPFRHHERPSVKPHLGAAEAGAEHARRPPMKAFNPYAPGYLRRGALTCGCMRGGRAVDESGST